MNKFKKGDKVTVADSCLGYTSLIGKILTIIFIGDNSSVAYKLASKDSYGWFTERELKPLTKLHRILN